MTVRATQSTQRIVAFVATGASADTLLPNQKAEQPDWPGTLTNGVRHWSGVLVPQSQTLANAVGWEVFDQFVYNAYSTWGYESPSDRLDKGVDGAALLQLYHEASLGPGESGGTTPSSKQLDHRTSAGAYDGYETWVTDTRTFRYAKSKLTFTNASGKVVLSKMIQAYRTF